MTSTRSTSLKIAQLSDLHIRSTGYRESKILEILKTEQPDAILITGDSIAENANYEALRNFLGNLHAPLGICLIGIDDEMVGNPNLKEALKNVPKQAFKIGLFHSPAFFDQTNGYFNLALSGHTHGGQVRLPLLPPLWLPEGSGRFVSGWYNNGDSRMYVSRGLGNSF